MVTILEQRLVSNLRHESVSWLLNTAQSKLRFIGRKQRLKYKVYF